MLTETSRSTTSDERDFLWKKAHPYFPIKLLRKIFVPADTIVPSYREYQRDYEGARIQCLQVRTAGFVIGEEWGDEGPIYFIDAGGANILYLSGQWLLDPFRVQNVKSLLSEETGESSWF